MRAHDYQVHPFAFGRFNNATGGCNILQQSRLQRDRRGFPGAQCLNLCMGLSGQLLGRSGVGLQPHRVDLTDAQVGIRIGHIQRCQPGTVGTRQPYRQLGSAFGFR